MKKFRPRRGLVAAILAALLVAAAVAVVEEAYREAREHHCRAVVIATQANVFDEEHASLPDYVEVFTPLVRALAQQSSRFDGQTHLLNGDSHVFGFGRPLAAGSPWPARYGVEQGQAVRQVTVDGAQNSRSFLRLTIEPDATGEVLTGERVPYKARG